MIKHSRAAHVRRPQPGISPTTLFRQGRAPRMKFLRFALIAFFALLVALFALASFKSSVWSAEGALVIEAPPEKILPLIATPKRWLDWDLWSDPSEPGFESKFEGPESGSGAKMIWKTATKNGQLEILSASAADGVRYKLDLDDMPGQGQIRFEPYGVQTRVRWSYSGDLGWNLAGRFVIPFMQKALVNTMQKGLNQLREKVLAGG